MNIREDSPEQTPLSPHTVCLAKPLTPCRGTASKVEVLAAPQLCPNPSAPRALGTDELAVPPPGTQSTQYHVTHHRQCWKQETQKGSDGEMSPPDPNKQGGWGRKHQVWLKLDYTKVYSGC